MGAYPALATVLLMALLLWLGNRPDALWGLLPAIIPCVALLMVSGYDEISVTRVLPLTLVVVLLSFTGVAIGRHHRSADEGSSGYPAPENL